MIPGYGSMVFFRRLLRIGRILPVFRVFRENFLEKLLHFLSIREYKNFLYSFSILMEIKKTKNKEEISS